MQRLFSIEEANDMIPQLSELIPRLQSTASSVQQIRQERETLQEHVRLNGNAQHLEALAREQTRQEAQLRAALATLQEAGCELKDLATGLVDFPHRRDGRVVYLCWRLGETEIGYWHDLNSGFSGRQPL